MNLYIINHGFHYELENLARLFYPNEKITVIKSPEALEPPYIATELSDKLSVSVKIGEYQRSSSAALGGDVENERMLCEMLYKILVDLTDITPPWGMITGVRPVKLYRALKSTEGEENADKYYRDKLFVSDEKLRLAKITEKVEKRIINLSSPKSFSLYIAIPFCPSRCRYCSFVQSSTERSAKLIEPYVKLLCEEIERTAEIVSGLDLRLETVYMGGGTPTTLSPEQMDTVLSAVNRSFDVSGLREFTVEAGRPDTVTAEKLISIKENKVKRISINPQTLSDSVLEAVGRRHTAEQFFRAFELARKIGFDSINTDLIAGLPTDTVEGFRSSLDGVIALDPECITVHALSMKRSATLTQDGTSIDRDDALRAGEMLSYAANRLTDSKYIPYYLYRQSRMVGNLENTGWSKKGFESLYNIYVMDETHTILGCGAGAVTKLKRFGTNYLERIFNFKYPYEYIDRFDELIDRKNGIYTFYDKYGLNF